MKLPVRSVWAILAAIVMTPAASWGTEDSKPIRVQWVGSAWMMYHALAPQCTEWLGHGRSIGPIRMQVDRVWPLHVLVQEDPLKPQKPQLYDPQRTLPGLVSDLKKAEFEILVVAVQLEMIGKPSVEKEYARTIEFLSAQARRCGAKLILAAYGTTLEDKVCEAGMDRLIALAAKYGAVVCPWWTAMKAAAKDRPDLVLIGDETKGHPAQGSIYLNLCAFYFAATDMDPARAGLPKQIRRWDPEAPAITLTDREAEEFQKQAWKAWVDVREKVKLSSACKPVHPADNLPPHITRLTWFGERPDWRHDGKRFAFLSKVFGDAYEYDLASGRVTPLTDHFPHHGFTRVMYLSNGDFLLVGPSRAFDATDKDARKRARHDDGVMFLLDKSLTRPPVPLGVECDEGPAISRKSLRIAWTHGKQDQISIADIVYNGGRPKLEKITPLIDSTKFGRPVKMIETQNFVPPENKLLTITAYGLEGGTNTDTYTLDLASGKLTNLTNSPDHYDEAEGIFPDGKSTTVEHGSSGGKPWPLVDIYRLALDGSGNLDRLTHFSEHPGWKATQSVVSDDGKSMLFQIGKAGTEAGQGFGIFLYDFEKARAP